MRKDFPLSVGGLSALSREAGTFPGVTERLIEARKRLGIMQKEMADHLGVSLRTYVRAEQGRRPLDVNEVARLAELGVDTGWLLTGMTGFAAIPHHGAVQIDRELMARIVDGLVTLYREENQRLAPLDQGRLQAEIYENLVRIDDEAERRGALRYALESHRSELRRAVSDPASSKRQG